MKHAEEISWPSAGRTQWPLTSGQVSSARAEIDGVEDRSRTLRSSIDESPPPLNTDGVQKGSLETRFYPERGAGGFTRVDGAIEFYTRVRALLRPDHQLLDFGAGRGWNHQDELVPFRASLARLDDACARVVGVDVDPAVLENPGLAEAHVVDRGAPLPFPDASFDIIVADHVFEHIDDPSGTVAELGRVLRPGGWICARTPNRWGYIALGARLVPNAAHTRVLAHLQPNRKAEDVFPTRYRLNTTAALERYLPLDEWSHHSYTYDSEPAYANGQAALWLLLWGWSRFLPAALAATRMVFVQKRVTNGEGLAQGPSAVDGPAGRRAQVGSEG